MRAAQSGALVASSAAASMVVARAALRASRASAARRRLPGDDRQRAAAAAGRRLPPPPRWAEEALYDAGITAPPSLAWWGAVAAVVSVATTALAFAGPLAAALAAIAGVVAPAAAIRTRRGRVDAQLEAALPAALEEIARSLRSGASLRQAVDEAAAATPPPLGGELARVAADAARGVPLVTALEGLAKRRPLPGVHLVTAALCLGVENGGAQARAVDAVAATLRDRLTVAAELRALSAHARYSALVISLAPIGFAGFAAVTDPRTAEFLFRTPAGIALLFAGLALDGLGALWMRRLVQADA